MAATKEKHFSECLHLINEAMEQPRLDSHHALPPAPSLASSSWSISEMGNTPACPARVCPLPSKSCHAQKVLKEDNDYKTACVPCWQYSDKGIELFHHQWTSFMKENDVFFFFSFL